MITKYQRSFDERDDSSAGQEFATYDEVKANAGIVVDGGIVYTNELDGYLSLDSGFSGNVALAEGGVLTVSGASGLKIKGMALTNGIAVELETADNLFTIGGDETYYTVDKDGEINAGNDYNSVIMVDSGTGNETTGYEAVYGVGSAINHGELWIKNSYIKSENTRSTAIYAFADHSAVKDTSIVVVDSHLEAHSDDIWMPSFKLLYGGARTTLLMSENNSWFYGSEIISNTWGAISQDSIDADTYVINCIVKAIVGGYCSYQTSGLYLYGSEMYAAQYGVFMCGTTHVLVDTAVAGINDTEGMMMKVPDYEVDKTASSIVVAPTNAVVVHTSLPGENQIATGDFNNSIFSTLKEDLPADVMPLSYTDDFFFPGINPNGEPCGQAYFFIRNLHGSVVLIRSMNANFTFNNTVMRSSNGVLLQSVVTYDPPSPFGHLPYGCANGNSGIYTTFKNGTYTGDILHEDYQRQMTVTLEANTILEGSVVSGTMASWNDKWSEENLLMALAEDGIDESVLSIGNPNWAVDVLSELKIDDSFDSVDCTGVNMVVKSGATWIVTKTSSLTSLTVEDGGIIKTPECVNYIVYYGCDINSANLFYRTNNSTELKTIKTGITYEKVVILVNADIHACPQSSA